MNFATLDTPPIKCQRKKIKDVLSAIFIPKSYYVFPLLAPRNMQQKIMHILSVVQRIIPSVGTLLVIKTKAAITKPNIKIATPTAIGIFTNMLIRFLDHKICQKKIPKPKIRGEANAQHKERNPTKLNPRKMICQHNTFHLLIQRASLNRDFQGYSVIKKTY